ncbi:FAD-dependent monooxygenase [Micromonospora sp. WMMD882]|uniref:FAD-dependent monooxygenase n=1 Tax=Micromonospora sp. WMMD882 TaxID=3015151 RepID=UPI00248D38EA|nr:FAD-dependent monooxygenase [Micromonospora sp. WMMD882]WBB80296.1 FAD-dependent monooxygenase [Micromonospora sp. WMMD882]
MTDRRRPKVIVIGAGIGGLTAAVALRRVGIEVEVYERATRLRPAGTALSLMCNALAALRTLDIDLRLDKHGQVFEELRFLTTRGRPIRTLRFKEIGDRLGETNVAIHRADLQQALLTEAGDCPIFLGATAERVETGADGVRVTFADGREAYGDVLIGADGFHSAVRRHLLGAETPQEAGYVCWLATIPFTHPRMTPGYVGHYWGAGQRFGLIDIGQGRAYWWGTRNMAPDEARRWRGTVDDIARVYRGWAPEVRAAIDATPLEAIVTVPAQDRPFLERWGAGPVTLLGDAAHPMLTSLGQGAAMAVEDAVVLATVLADAPDPVAGLREYEDRRRNRARQVVATSREVSRIEQLAALRPRLGRNLYFRFAPMARLNAANEAVLLTFDPAGS